MAGNSQAPALGGGGSSRVSSWLTKRSAGRKLNPVTKRHKSRSHECHVYKLEHSKGQKMNGCEQVVFCANSMHVEGKKIG
jgi:hypothetical protein